MELLRRWWPVLPALVIAWFGGSAFMEKYPRRAEGARVRTASGHGQDSLLARFRRELDAGRLAAADSATRAAGIENPFRPIRPARPEGRRPGVMAAPPPPRGFQLKGTVGRNVATISDAGGRKQIVKVGDSIDSAVVVSIEANKVVLKDRAGRFELLLER